MKTTDKRIENAKTTFVESKVFDERRCIVSLVKAIHDISKDKKKRGESI